MHIRSISLSNVKSFRDPVHVKLDPHFNLLIGPNGGGKSNLFDAITIVLRRYFLDSFKVSFHGPDKALKSAIREQEAPVLDRFIGQEKASSTVEIEMVITARDIANIRVIKSHLKTLNTFLEDYKWKPINNCNFIEKWDVATLEKERVVRYKIVNDSFSPAPEPGSAAFIFKEYLNYLEMFLLFAKDMGIVDLRPVLLNFFPIRSMTRDNIQVSLSLQNYYQLLHDFHLATSQDATSLMQLSTYYFAVKKLKLQEQSKHEGYLKLWNRDPEVDSVTKAIAHLGFSSWMPYPVELERGLYQILLEKDGKEYLISQASSGEKEILNFLIGIFGVRISGGLVIVDEPEIHLHPKWQSILFTLLLDITKKLDCQLVVSSHSPAFIDQESIGNAQRIYKKGDASTVVNVGKQYPDSTEIKGIVSRIKNLGNENIFFADRVVLVEGTLPRVVMDKLITHHLENTRRADIVAVVDVGTMEDLKAYKHFLDRLHIPVSVVAGLSYLSMLENGNVSSIFERAKRNMRASFNKLKAKDRNELLDLLQRSVSEGALRPEFTARWETLPAAHFSVDNLEPADREQIDQLVESHRKNHIYILKQGEMLDYLGDFAESLSEILAIADNKSFVEKLQASIPAERYLELVKIVSAAGSSPA